MISLSHQCPLYNLFHVAGVPHSHLSLFFLSGDLLCRKAQIPMDVCENIPPDRAKDSTIFLDTLHEVELS